MAPLYPILPGGIVRGSTLIETAPPWPGTIVTIRNMELISLHQPEEFGKGLKETLPVHCEPRSRAVLLGFLTLLLSTRVPFPNKISCFVSTYVSSDNSFPSVRQELSFGPWKGSLFLQQMVTLVGFFFAETDILTTRGTQGPAYLPMDQTQRPQLGPFCPWSPPDADNWPECPDR